MNVRCRHCGLDLQAPANSEGKPLACPGCGGKFLCQLPRAVVMEPLPATPAASARPVPQAPAFAAPSDPSHPCMASTIILPINHPCEGTQFIALHGDGTPLVFLDEPGQLGEVGWVEESGDEAQEGPREKMVEAAPPPAEVTLEQLADQAEAAEKTRQHDPLVFQSLEDPPRNSGGFTDRADGMGPRWHLLGQAQPATDAFPPASEGERATEPSWSQPWYVIIAGVPVAAMNFAQLRRKAQQGTIRPRDRLYYAPKNVQLRAIDVPGLFPAAMLRKKASRLANLFRRNKPAPPPVIPEVEQAQSQPATPTQSLWGQPPPSDNSDLTALLRALDGLPARTPEG